MRRPISLVLATFAAALVAISSACEQKATEPGPVPSQLTLTLPELILSDGASVTLAFVLRDQSGAVMERPPADAMPVWTSSDTVIASVQDGVVVARHPGMTTVSVAVGPLEAHANVVVTAVPVAIRIEGDSVRSVTNGEPAAPLVVRVVDRHGEGVAGVKVSFAVESGGGSLSADTVVSDSVGLAKATWDTGAGRVQRVRVSAASFPSVTFVGLTFSVAGSAGDTVVAIPLGSYALDFSGSVSAPHPIEAVRYSIDGAPELSALIAGGDDGSTHFSIYVLLSRAKHTVVVTAVDSAGIKGEWRRTVDVRDVAVRSYTLQALDLLDGTDGGALDLNESGDVVGWIARASGDTLAVLWRSGTPLLLADGLSARSTSTGISGDGEVVGTFHDGECIRSFRWQNGNRTLFDGCSVSAIDVNERGTVLFRDGTVLRDGMVTDVGVSSGNTSGSRYAVRIDRSDTVLMWYFPAVGCGGGFCALGPLVIRPPYTSGDATFFLGLGVPADMNDAGDVVGTCAGGSVQGTCGGLIHLATGETFTLTWPTIGGTGNFQTRGGAYGINNSGAVVGLIAAYASESPFFPYLWKDRTFYRLTTTDPDWIVDGIAEINEKGQIAAHAHNVTTGQKGAVLLTPAG